MKERNAFTGKRRAKKGKQCERYKYPIEIKRSRMDRKRRNRRRRCEFKEGEEERKASMNAHTPTSYFIVCSEY
jgi:hypothetical protein